MIEFIQKLICCGGDRKNNLADAIKREKYYPGLIN